MDEAVQRESKNVRENAGVLDGSTLGKIEIKGKDALAFMNLIAIFDLVTLHQGLFCPPDELNEVAKLFLPNCDDARLETAYRAFWLREYHLESLLLVLLRSY